ncbi:MAG: hypothetical protein RIA63_01570, partial [Cyclobacteriaceae bacterium]
MTRFSLAFALLYIINIHLSAQSKIIFSRSSGGLNTGGTLDLMIYNPGDKSTKLLLKGTVSGRGEYNVATSPDNSKIVFSTYRFSGWKLGIGDFKNETITNVRQLVTGSDYRYNVKYSPNGSKIVYQEYSWSSGNTNIMIADQDGKNVTPLVKDKGHNRTPDWLRNGQTIIFSSARGDSHCIYSKEVTGRNLKELTDNKGNDFAPSASRVEDKIAFLSDRGGKVNLYVMDIDGGNKINLTTTLKSDS